MIYFQWGIMKYMNYHRIIYSFSTGFRDYMGVFRKLQTPPEIMRKLPISGELCENYSMI